MEVVRCEESRLAALRSYGILDSPREEEFDKLVMLACQIFGMPMAAISFVETDRQWFKAEVGLGCDQTPIDCSICYHAVRENTDLFVVEDTLADTRISCNPLVKGNPGLRFYAGAALRTPEGLSLGTLLLLDTRPRTLPAAHGDLLQTLAKQVMLMLEARKVSVERLHLYERVRSDLDLRRDVLAIVSHDLRSPLNTISLVSQMSGEMAAKMENGAQLAEMNRILISSADDMLRLINDLSEYSRIDQEQLVMRFREVSVDALEDGLARRFRLLAENAGTAFRIFREEGLPDSIVADVHRLIQAAGNLIANAISFTPRGGNISVRLSRVDGFLKISVSNTGEEIAAENLENIFRRFWTRGGSGKANRGLGLSIAASIARAHCGEITVESKEGLTTFTITASLCLEATRDGGELMVE